MKFLLSIFKGIALGAGAILPGISSGVLCVIFGIYETIISSILNFFQDMKKNILFLLPIIIGILIGVLIFGNILKFLFETYPMQTQFSFIGLILGSLPILLKKANKNKGFRLHYIIFLLIAFLLGIFLIFLENCITSSTYLQVSPNFLFLVVAGFFMSIGVVVPGVSSSVILMILGVYEIYLDSISHFYLPILVPMGIGLIIGGIIFLSIIKFLLEHYYSETFYTIIGFVLGSIFILYPGFNFSFTGIASLICFFISFYIALQFEKISTD